MSLQPASFPTQVWDGTTLYNAKTDDKSPNFVLSDRIIAELLAVQEYVLSNGILNNPGDPHSLLSVQADGVTLEWKTITQGANITIQKNNGELIISATGDLSGSVAWGLITGTLADQTDLQAALDGKAASSHTHSISNITGLQAALDALDTEISGKADSVHTHTIGQVTGLQSALDGKSDIGHTHTVSDITALTASRALTTNGSGIIAVSSVTSTELGYLSGVTSAIQTQLAGKAASSHTHTVADISALTVNRALVTNGSGVISVSTVTSTEVGYLSGLSGNIQAQIDAIGGGGGGGTWGSITGTLSDQTDLQAALDAKAAATHSHSISDVTGLQAALDAKSDIGHTHTVSDISALTVSRALQTNGSGVISVSSVTTTELGYLSGVTSAIQTQFSGKANTSHTHAISDVTGLQAALDGKAALSHTHTVSDISALTASRALVTNSSGVISVSTVTSTEVGYLSGVSSSIQTQLGGKAATVHTHSISDVTGLQAALDAKAAIAGWTADRVMVSDGTGNLSASTITTTLLGYLSGLTGNIQDQIDSLGGGGGMAIVKTKTSITQLTASGTSVSVDTTDYSRLSMNIKHHNGSATITAGAVYQVQIQPEGSSEWYNFGGQFVFPTTATTDYTRSITLPGEIGAVRISYTAPTGGSGHTADAEVSMMSGI